ncbi:ribonuclease H-like domain-containing protein [Tanacetum coccineum]
MNKKNLFLLKDMDQDYAHMVVASKVPTLKPGEYEIWRMSIEQDIQMIDYAIWEVIENGATLPKTKIMEGVMTEMPITTAEEKAQRRLEVKARSTLMMGISNEHQLKFNSIKDAKKLNKADLDTMSMDDLYNNLKVYEPEVKEMSSSSLINVANSTNIDNLSDAVICSFFASQPNSSQLVHEDLLLAMLTMRARRFLKNTRRKLTINGNETISFDKSKVECYNCHKRGHFARECRASRNQDNKNKESSRRSVPVEISTSTTLVSCDGLGGYDRSDHTEERPNYALMAFSFDSEVIRHI